MTTVTFSLFSGLGLRRDNTAGRLASPGRMSTGAAVRRATSALVVAEIALAIVLLSGAGLLLRSFSNLLSVDPGFSTDRVLTLTFAVPTDRYQEIGAREALHQRLFESIGRVDGVEQAGAAAVTPLTGNNWTVPFDRADKPVPAGQRPPDVGWQSATGGYFRALGIPLRDGRYFGPQDGPKAPAVVIISEAVAARFFAGERAVGHRIRLGDAQAEIVGVVGDIRRAALTDTPARRHVLPDGARAERLGDTVHPHHDRSNEHRSVAANDPAIDRACDHLAFDPDDGGSHARVRSGDGARSVAARTVRGHCRGACGDRDLRGDVVRRPAAHARDRHACRAWRNTLEHPLAGAGPRRARSRSSARSLAS